VSLVFHSKEKRKNLKKKWRQERCKRVEYLQLQVSGVGWAFRREKQKLTGSLFLKPPHTRMDGWASVVSRITFGEQASCNMQWGVKKCCFKNNLIHRVRYPANHGASISATCFFTGRVCGISVHVLFHGNARTFIQHPEEQSILSIRRSR